ncbi:hypothetical protein TNCV_1871131 [Trichonephila clavipes]|nr:hypothetical protein TNCV_1871131 [Trichonephila clavipes]
MRVRDQALSRFCPNFRICSHFDEQKPPNLNFFKRQKGYRIPANNLKTKLSLLFKKFRDLSNGYRENGPKLSFRQAKTSIVRSDRFSKINVILDLQYDTYYEEQTKTTRAFYEKIS